MPAKLKLSRNAEPYLKIAVGILLVAMAIAKVWVRRGLVADAPYFLIAMLDQHGFSWMDEHRAFAIMLTQLPTVIAMYLGVTSMRAFTYIYSSSLLLEPVLCWGAAFWLLRREFLFWPFVAIFSFAYYNANFSAISEYNLCFGLAAICFAILLRTAPNTAKHYALLLASAVLLWFSYASTLFLCTWLCFLVTLRFFKEKDSSMQHYWLLLSIVFIVGAMTGLWEVVYPRDPKNFASARDMAILAYNREFWLSLGIVALSGLTVFRLPRAAKQIIGVIAGLLPFLMVLPGWFALPAMHYQTRAFTAMAFFGLMVAISLFALFRKNRLFTQESNRDFLPACAFVPAFSLLLILTLIDMRTSYFYGFFIDDFQRTVDRNTGFVAYERTATHFAANNLFSSIWTNPIMSTVLRTSPHGAIVLNPAWYTGFQPYQPDKIPDMSSFYSSPDQ